MIARSVERSILNTAPITGGCENFARLSGMPKKKRDHVKVKTRAQERECSAAGKLLMIDAKKKWKTKAARELAGTCKRLAVKKVKRKK